MAEGSHVETGEAGDGLKKPFKKLVTKSSGWESRGIYSFGGAFSVVAMGFVVLVGCEKAVLVSGEMLFSEKRREAG